MAVGILLSGGIGTRMDLETMPKQYIRVGEFPIIVYAAEAFDRSRRVESMVVVAAAKWQSRILGWFRDAGFTTPVAFAEAGASRQQSILNGLLAASGVNRVEDIVVVHDAARPNLRVNELDSYIGALKDNDAVLPALPMNDTMYRSASGRIVDAMLSRSEVFAGQAPEVFRYEAYLALNMSVSEEELEATRGSSEIAFRHGMRVAIVPGDFNNYKVTTKADLRRLCEQRGVDFDKCLKEARREMGRPL